MTRLPLDFVRVNDREQVLEISSKIMMLRAHGERNTALRQKPTRCTGCGAPKRIQVCDYCGA